MRLVNDVAAEKLTGVGIRVPHGTMNYENGATTIDGMKPGQKLDANESVANEPAATTVATGKFGSGSIIEDSGTPSADSSEGSLMPPKAAETIIGIDPRNVSGSARFVRVGASIMIFFESLYLLADRSSLDGFRTIVFPLHLFIFLTLIGYAIVARSRVSTLHRQAVVLGACLVIFAATGGLAIATGNDEFLVLTLMIVLVGSSALVAWGTRWQAMLSLSSLGAMAAWSLWAPVADPQSAIHWAAVCAAAAYAQLTAWIGERYRDELDGRFKELYANHRRLVGEIAGRERAVAANEVSNRRLRDSETKLRKIFATSVDAITISRLSDGRYLDLNEGFSRWSGYSREEVVGQTAGSLGIWGTRKQLRQFIDQIETTGAVTNFECEVRSKDGILMPSLTSATVVELGGEACVVAIARDITAFNQTQRDLIAAREVMRAQIEALEHTEGLLRAEIIERVAAVGASEIAHQQLTESEAKLRKIFETSGDLISINRVSDGRYLEANDAYRTVGYTRDEMLARSAAGLGIWANREQLRECMKMLASGRTVANMEIDLRAKNGRVAPFLVSAKIIELSGEACVVAIARDITAIKQAQHELIAAREQMAQQLRALQESEKRLRAEVAERELAQDRANQSARVLLRIFNTTQVGISINRVADGRFLQINAAYAEILGYTCEELLRLTVRETGLIANRAHFRQFVADLERLGSIPEIEMDLRSRDGTLHPLQVSAVKLEVDGAPCYATIVVDISRRKRIEHELIAAREAALAASQAKSEFLSSMSHEIRTPMNAIQGLADLLWESDLSVEQRRYLATMRRNGNALLDLINEILDLAKVESGRLHLEQISIDLRDLMEKLLETLAPRAHAKGLELIGRFPPGTPAVLVGDPLRLRQILFNLIGNAIKFTQTGEIELTLERVAAPALDPTAEIAPHAAYWHSGGDSTVWMRMTVRDTGIGIPPAQAKAIFSSFTQADSSIARKYGGSGLGLTIVTRLVELMNGAITVESEPGAGSSFTVTVPLETPSAEYDPPESESPSFAADALAGLRVLVVGDAGDSRIVLRELLQTAGATVDEASSVEEAVAKAMNINTNMLPYNVLLLDERMPGSDGIETARRIAQASDGKAHSAIILMLPTTALATAPERIEQIGRDLGSECRYLVKPIKRADLLGAVMEITGRRLREKIRSDYGSQAPDPKRGAATISVAALAPSRPLRILLADDSADNRMLIDAYMKKAPYTIDHAEDGSIAVEKVKANHYDLVLMDIQMPVMDGYTAVRTIREWERAQGRPRMPIVALTASALDESVQRSLEAGCDAHVSKPVKKSTLFEVILEVTEAAVGGDSGNGESPVTTNGATPIKRQQINVDADLRDLVPNFLEHKRADVGIIQTAIDRSDYETICKIGHKMKGEGGSYGFDAVTTMGASLEQAGLDQNLAAARDTLGEFTEYLESVDVVYS